MFAVFAWDVPRVALSEVNPQQELDLPWRARADRANVDRADDLAEGAASAGVVEVAGVVGERLAVLRMVEQIEELGAELKLHLFAERDVLGESQISLPEAGTADQVAPCVPISSPTNWREGCGVDPLAGRRSSGGVSETCGTRLGRWLVVYPVATELLVRLIVTLTGRPVRAVTMLERLQLPKIALVMPDWAKLRPLPKGS